jgi:hypothetical protein
VASEAPLDSWLMKRMVMMENMKFSSGKKGIIFIIIFKLICLMSSLGLYPLVSALASLPGSPLSFIVLGFEFYFQI